LIIIIRPLAIIFC